MDKIVTVHDACRFKDNWIKSWHDAMAHLLFPFLLGAMVRDGRRGDLLRNQFF